MVNADEFLLSQTNLNQGNVAVLLEDNPFAIQAEERHSKQNSNGLIGPGRTRVKRGRQQSVQKNQFE